MKQKPPQTSKQTASKASGVGKQQTKGDSDRHISTGRTRKREREREPERGREGYRERERARES